MYTSSSDDSTDSSDSSSDTRCSCPSCCSVETFESIEEITERPVILIPDLSSLKHPYTTKQPYILKDHIGDKKLLDCWREKQLILYEYINNCNGSESDIEDPCPYKDSWYIFGLPPFIDKSIYNIIINDKVKLDDKKYK